MRHDTASSIRALAKEVPSLQDKTISKILERVKETVTDDNRRTALLVDMSGSSLDDTKAISAKLIKLGFEVEHQYYSFVETYKGMTGSFPGKLVNDLVVSWAIPDSLYQVGSKEMNKAEFEHSVVSMKKAVRTAWEACGHPIDFVACLDEVLSEGRETSDNEALADLRRKVEAFMKVWYE